MSKVFIQEETLSNIGAAIREKTGKTDLIAPGNMPTEIRGIVGGSDPVIERLEVTSNGTYNVYDGVDGFGPVVVNVPQDWTPAAEDLVLTGDCSKAFQNGRMQSFIQQFGRQMTTENLEKIDTMFSNCMRLTEIPFELNFVEPSYSTLATADNAFLGCTELRSIPRMNNFHPYRTSYMFANNFNLREFPEDFFDSWHWHYWDDATSATGTVRSSMFDMCFSLRKYPMVLLAHGNPKVKASTYSAYNSLVYQCNSLDEMVGIPTPRNADIEVKENLFHNTFVQTHRLKRLTFEPCTINWTNQTIDLSDSVGWCNSGFFQPLYYNSGITADKEVKDDATYQTLKNDPDWFTLDVRYSRYNHDSAVETINSLPMSNGGNTIKFKGEAGSLTDGGAINTLTEEEIAVAAAKGWTVSFI